MVLFENDEGTYLTMQSYIELMLKSLDVDMGRRSIQVPMSQLIMDMALCNDDERKQFMSAAGMVGWLSATGRPELRLYHSHVARDMANPVKGALEAVIRIVRYAGQNKDLCLFQPWGSNEVSWRFYSDSDQFGNCEEGNKCCSQLSHIAMNGRAPIVFGSKTTSVQLGPNLESLGGQHRGLHRPTCHPDMTELHADVSSAVSEIYATSIALNEHLTYITDELGLEMPAPIHLACDNATAILFSKGTTHRSKLRNIDARQAWVEALRDENMVKMTKVHTCDNLADLNSKMLDVCNFVQLRDCIMTRHAIPSVDSLDGIDRLG